MNHTPYSRYDLNFDSISRNLLQFTNPKCEMNYVLSECFQKLLFSVFSNCHCGCLGRIQLNIIILFLHLIKVLLPFVLNTTVIFSIGKMSIKLAHIENASIKRCRDLNKGHVASSIKYIVVWFYKKKENGFYPYLLEPKSN